MIYADIKSLIKKTTNECKNNIEKSSTTKEGEYVLSGFSMSTTWLFKNIKNMHDVHRSEDWMKEFGNT